MDSPYLFLFTSRRLLRSPPPRPRNRCRRRPRQHQPDSAFVYDNFQAQFHREAYNNAYPGQHAPYDNPFGNRQRQPHHMPVNNRGVAYYMDDQAILDQLFDQQHPLDPLGEPAWYVAHLENLLHAHDEPTECEFTSRVLALALNDYDMHLGPPFLEIRDVPTLARLCVGWITVHGGGEVVTRLAAELELARADDHADDPRQERQAREA